MSVFVALTAAKKAGVKLTLAGDGIVLETKTPPLPADVVELLRSVKPGLMRILACREAATAAIAATAPPDCRPDRWIVARQGLERFVAEGWGDVASAFGWTPQELYRVPELWRQVHLTGAALLVADRRVLAVTTGNIVIGTRAGSELKFRRIGREHIA
jgi:hypothetical protein